MKERVTLRLSISKWLLVLIAVITVTGLAVGLWAILPTSTAGRGPAGYGGTVMITFVPSATAADRAAVMSTCGSLPGVTRSSMNPDGAGSITGPLAGESGADKATLALHQAQRQRIYSCLKGSPFVASTVEGL